MLQDLMGGDCGPPFDHQRFEPRAPNRDQTRILLLNPPGRLPTVMHDVGSWWDHLGAKSNLHLASLSANYSWWRQLASRRDFKGGVEPNAMGPPVGKVVSQTPALLALDAFRRAETFQSLAHYLKAVDTLERHLHVLNGLQDEFKVAIAQGPVVALVDYTSSRSIIEFASGPSLLSEAIETSLGDLGSPDIVLMRITTEFELLTCAILAKAVRRRHPSVHICLFDHGYENFSLTPHMPSLQGVGALAEVFDTIIMSKDEIDGLVVRLVERLEQGIEVRGFLQADDFNDYASLSVQTRLIPPLMIPIFAPEPVLHTRLSTRRCYWSRCTFCSQNSKYDDPGAPGKSEVAAAVERWRRYRDVGFTNLILTDEAISPAILKVLAESILRTDLRVHWSCRCKLEKSYNVQLFQLLAAAGCKEILFGLETTSESLLRKMDKVVEGQGEADIAVIFKDAGAAGIGLHINLISGFPGESLEEADGTVDFVADALQALPNTTFLLNPFTVFPDTPIAEAPGRFGISELYGPGDMPSAYAHRLNAPNRRRTTPVLRSFDGLVAELETRLGWRELTASPEGRAAFELYSASGHSAVFKAQRQNPFDQARDNKARQRRWKRPPARRRAVVTGATGNVGGAIVSQLIADAWEVSALIREGADPPLDCLPIVADLFDLPDLSQAFDGMDAIFHCASPRSLNRQEMLVGEVDAMGRLLDAWSTGAFVYMSSQTIYGVPSGVLTEETPPAPGNWYDLSKITNEHQLSFTSAMVGGPGVALRLPLIFGAGQRRRDRQFLASIFDALRQNQTFLFEDEAVMESRGTVYIGDLDLGRVSVSAASLSTSGVYNIAAGFVSWGALIRGLSAIMGVKPSITFRTGGPIRADEFCLPRSRSFFDCSKFESATHFQPIVSLEETLEKFVQAERDSGLASSPVFAPVTGAS